MKYSNITSKTSILNKIREFNYGQRRNNLSNT